MRYSFILTLLFLLSSSCRSPEYLTFDKQEEESALYPISTLQLDSNIDIIMVVDNSGSMNNIQSNIIKNASLFFEQFAQKSLINWKLGIISTDKSEKPYLGFDKPFASKEFDRTNPDSYDSMINIFKDSIKSLGTDGDAYEYINYNVENKIKDYPFLRNDAHLVVIMISDENEQSRKFDQGPKELYKPINFYNRIRKKLSPGKELRFYSAIAHRDFPSCKRSGYSAIYSPVWDKTIYNALITLSNGFNISACSPDFGNELARVGEDIANLVGEPSLLLKDRPVLETLRVFFKDKSNELYPGAPEDGGQWYYSERYNTINFYNLDFVKDFENDKFIIEFEIEEQDF